MINESHIHKIAKLLSTNDKCVVEYRKSMNKHMLFGSNNETEIMFYEFRNEIVIQRINIENNHNGCFTKIIKVFSGIDGVQSIRIQSVLTREMAEWCNKNGYKPVGYCEKLEDYIVGDYVKHYK